MTLLDDCRSMAAVINVQNVPQVPLALGIHYLLNRFWSRGGIGIRWPALQSFTALE